MKQQRQTSDEGMNRAIAIEYRIRDVCGLPSLDWAGPIYWNQRDGTLKLTNGGGSLYAANERVCLGIGLVFSQQEGRAALVSVQKRFYQARGVTA